MIQPDPRPSSHLWLRRQPARSATILEILILFLVSAAGFMGAAALVQAFSMREVEFAPRLAKPGSSMEVRWLFFGMRVWSEHFSTVADVVQRQLVTRGDYDPADPNPAKQVEVLTVFVDDKKQDLFTARQSSLLGQLGRMHDYLTGPIGGASVFTVRETERWWASEPLRNLVGGAIGLLLGLALGGFFLVGTFSALRVRLSRSQAGATSGGVFRPHR